MRDNAPPPDREYPYENEVKKEPENAWPAWLRLPSGLTPIHAPPPPPNNPDPGFRSVALLGRFQGQPYLTLKIFKKRGRSWKATKYSATLSLPEFRVLLVKLNDVLTRRPELGEDRQIGRWA